MPRFFDASYNIVKKVNKAMLELYVRTIDDYTTTDDDGTKHYDKAAHEAFMAQQEEAMTTVETLHVKKAIELTERLTALVKPKTTPVWYAVVSPNPDGLNVPEFVEKVHKVGKMKLFGSCVYSFEQRGTTPETLGNGVHANFVGTTTLAKSQVIQRLAAAFKDFATANNVHVTAARNAPNLVNEYLVAYNSDDGHKEPMLHWDKLWRGALSLQALYGDVENPLFRGEVTSPNLTPSVTE